MLKPQSGQSTETRGTCTFAYHEQLTAVRWRDNKDVYALSTAYSDLLTVVKHHIDGVTQDIPCPYVIHDYNSFMGGVDLADQPSDVLLLSRPNTIKWWH